MDSKLHFCETDTNSQITNYEFPNYSSPPRPLSLLFIFVVQNGSLAIVAPDGATVAATICHQNIDART